MLCRVDRREDCSIVLRLFSRSVSVVGPICICVNAVLQIDVRTILPHSVGPMLLSNVVGNVIGVIDHFNFHMLIFWVCRHFSIAVVEIQVDLIILDLGKLLSVWIGTVVHVLKLRDILLVLEEDEAESLLG